MSQNGVGSAVCSHSRNAALQFLLTVLIQFEVPFTEVLAVLQKWTYRGECYASLFFPAHVTVTWFMFLMDFEKVVFTKEEYIKHYIYHGSPRKMTLLPGQEVAKIRDMHRGLVWSKVRLARTLQCQLVFPRLTSLGEILQRHAISWHWR